MCVLLCFREGENVENRGSRGLHPGIFFVRCILTGEKFFQTTPFYTECSDIFLLRHTTFSPRFFSTNFFSPFHIFFFFRSSEKEKGSDYTGIFKSIVHLVSRSPTFPSTDILYSFLSFFFPHKLHSFFSSSYLSLCCPPNLPFLFHFFFQNYYLKVCCVMQSQNKTYTQHAPPKTPLNRRGFEIIFRFQVEIECCD